MHLIQKPLFLIVLGIALAIFKLPKRFFAIKVLAVLGTIGGNFGLPLALMGIHVGHFSVKRS